MSSMVRLTGAWTGVLTDWLDREGIPATDVRNRLARYGPEDAVPVPEWRDLLARALALVPERAAPELEIGAGVQPRHLGVLGYLVLASETLGEAMQAYERYERLFYGRNLAQVVASGDEIELRWHRDAALLGQQGDGVAIAALITFLRDQMKDPPTPSLVTFAGATDAPEAYEAFFQAPVRFNDSWIRVRFPARYLGIAMPHGDPALRDLLDRQARALLETLPHGSGFDAALRNALPRLLTEGRTGLEAMAVQLHVSPRTLQRRLAVHGMSWQQFLDRGRNELARQYLADPSLALTDVALLLGFSEQSAFNRAFRRWNGVTPGQWRARGDEWEEARGRSCGDSEHGM